MNFSTPTIKATSPSVSPLYWRTQWFPSSSSPHPTFTRYQLLTIFRHSDFLPPASRNTLSSDYSDGAPAAATNTLDSDGAPATATTLDGDGTPAAATYAMVMAPLLLLLLRLPAMVMIPLQLLLPLMVMAPLLLLLLAMLMAPLLHYLR
jgi:hypothetical protein